MSGAGENNKIQLNQKLAELSAANTQLKNENELLRMNDASMKEKYAGLQQQFAS